MWEVQLTYHCDKQALAVYCVSEPILFSSILIQMRQGKQKNNKEVDCTVRTRRKQGGR